MVVELSQEDFKQKVFDYEQHQDWQYKGDKPCIIDFYADWCQPCKMVSPILEQISEKFADHLYVYKVDVDENGEIAALFGISSIPSILFASMTELPRIEVGALPLPSILQIIDEELGLAIEAE
jgi:thioredoxin